MISICTAVNCHFLVPMTSLFLFSIFTFTMRIDYIPEIHSFIHLSVCSKYSISCIMSFHINQFASLRQSTTLEFYLTTWWLSTSDLLHIPYISYLFTSLFSYGTCSKWWSRNTKPMTESWNVISGLILC